VIDVVVPLHNRWALTERCLQTLAAQTVAHNVIVVDNGSTDGTPKSVRAAFPHVHVVELRANAGFSAACNSGVRAGDGSIVVLLNNDVECSPDFLERLVVPLAEDESIGSVAALLLEPGEQRIESFGLAVDRTLAGYPRLRGRPSADAVASSPVLAGPTGAAAAYRRSAWEQVAGLDEGVFAYGEDVDLAAVALHVGSATAGVRSPPQRYEGGFSRGYFLRRYGVLRTRAALRALATEALASGADALVYSHDLAAVRGRVSGWRAAGGRPAYPPPPREAIDHTITFAESLRLRRAVYACTSV
jgi:N-acetylglucosaminyl-diphospho-decaprenol L-rhamnosyltransferase